MLERATPIDNTGLSEDDLTIIPPVDLHETPSNLAATISAPNPSPEPPTTPPNIAPTKQTSPTSKNSTNEIPPSSASPPAHLSSELDGFSDLSDFLSEPENDLPKVNF